LPRIGQTAQTVCGLSILIIFLVSIVPVGENFRRNRQLPSLTDI
jgi:hypothetical protein